MNTYPCSTRAAVRRRCRKLRPSLHWKGLLITARERADAPGRGPEGTGNCSSCYEAQANLKVKTQSRISDSWLGTDGNERSKPEISRRESRREARRDVGGDGGRRGDSEVAALIGKNNAKGRFISCSRQLVAGGHRAGWTCSAPTIRGTYQQYADWCSHYWEDVD